MSGAGRAIGRSSLTAGVAEHWDRLAHPAAAADRFDPDMLAGLPTVARDYLAHALTPGVRLSSAVLLSMHGEIRLGSWRRFTARQVLAPGEGFVWAASARVAGLPVTGFDRYTGGTGQMRWRLLGIVPVMSASGPDTTRSAAGRLAAEAVLCPTAFRRCRWEQAVAADTVRTTWQLHGRDESVDLTIDDDGRLLEVSMQRWGNPDGHQFGAHPFGVAVEEERDFGGVRLPSRFHAGWWWGTDRQPDGEFFRATIDDVTFC